MSNFIAVDLKVIEVHAPLVARQAGVAEDRIVAGLVRLWHRCWSTTSDRITLAQLAGVFGPDRIEDVAKALLDNFLEQAPDDFRVRGAARYLRLKKARSEGAKKTNAKRWASDHSGRSKSDVERSLPVALSPNTEHRTPKKETGAPASPRPSDLLVQDFNSCVGETYMWQGAKDGVALAELLKVATLEEVRTRWRRGLAQGPGWERIRTVAQLRAKWNDLATAKPQTEIPLEHRLARRLD